MLVLATFRDTEADVPAELADALADLRRSDDVVRLRLSGLSEQESGSSCAAAGGGELDPAEPDALPRAARPHRGQRLPALRALAGARGDRRVRDRRRHPAADCARCTRSQRPQSVHEVVSQRLAQARSGEPRAARAGRCRRTRVRARRPAPRGARRARADRRAGTGDAQRDDRGAARSPRWPTASRTSSCAARCMTG